MRDLFSSASCEGLPNDPEQLKERILRQTILLGFQVIELDDQREQIRQLQRQNRQLRALLTPTN
ncbi:hypothetical protein [Spirosoma rhododendri]|uniref:Uncharacterized protein n=1 Tax=Spirosoma rhododendri TaxID=2728024 RepID=A0A7L5DUE4_9BACT|nr:hypothetical protein [Spirosoma rhododendri]QJD79587.1 hypothetical protein HH216_15050 [Spirosoma rhododendri]